MKRRAVIPVIAVCVLLLTLAVWMLVSDQATPALSAALPSSAQLPSSKGRDEKPNRSPVVGLRSPIDPARPVITGTPAPTAATSDEGRSLLADKLHAPENSDLQDAAIVMNLFTGYRGRFRGYPVGEDNAAFVRALTGHNPGRIALLPPDHPAIDSQGQLLDRWGKPFFFHLLDREALEIRSAGPDRQLYTADDIVKKSPQADAATLAIRED